MKDLRNLEIGDWLRVFWRRKWYFFVTAILISAGVSIYAWQLQLVYRSETRILVESAIVSEDYVRPIFRATPAERINAIREQIKSRSFLQRIIQDYQLFGFNTNKDFSMEQAILSLQSHLSVETSGSNTMTISYSHSDPYFARDVTKGLTTTLIDSHKSARTNKAEETDQFIDEQLRQIEIQLAAQDQKVKQFKTAHLGELPEQGMANVNALSTLDSQLAVLDNSLQLVQEQRRFLDIRMQEQKRLSVLSRNLFGDSVSAAMNITPESKAKDATAVDPQLAAKKALLTQLKARFTDSHPDVLRLAREVDVLEKQQNAARAAAIKDGENAELTPLGSAKKTGGNMDLTDANGVPIIDVAASDIRMEMEKSDSEIARRRKERDELVKQIKIVQGRIGLAPALEQELSTLTRDQDLLRQQYKDLQIKKYNSRMSKSLEAATGNEIFKVVDDANVPERPAFPNRVHIILMGIGAGIVLGLGAVFSREYFDSAISNEVEAVALLNLPVLASIPEVLLEGIPERKGIPQQTG